MYKTQTSQPSSFKKKLLATAITSIAVLGASEVVMAQSSDGTVEEVVVTGIRASLQRSMDLKRDAKGVVDAISAEDIGKFPDTNLAESLQRITGVAIDRSNGEGSKVTVRGFGPEFNLVTLNGRQMPTSTIGSTWTASTRSFDFANLASESVSGVEVYKTGRADLSTGGIGSTINIKTARPLDKPGFQATAGVKEVFDTSAIDGTSHTPEFSGLVSDTFADDKIGVLLSASYQKRTSGEQKAQTGGWMALTESDFGVNTQIDDSANENPDGTIWYPQSMGGSIGETDRTRTNGQLVLQYAPVDSLKATLDYTYSELEVESKRNEFGAWYVHGANTTYVNVDKNGTAYQFEETGGDYSFNRFQEGSKNENKSIGLNLDWQVTDSLNLTFDGHSSSAESSPLGYGNSALLIAGAYNVVSKTFDASGDIPLFDFVFPTADQTASPADIGTQFAITRQSYMKTDIDEYQLKGVWKNQNESGLEAINFGVASTKMKQDSQHSEQFLHNPSWGYSGKELYDDALFTKKSLGSFLDGFSGHNGAGQVGYYYDYDLAKVLPVALGIYSDNDADFGVQTPNSVDQHIITEETSSAYLQFDFSTTFNDMPFDLLTGMRWEGTDVVAQSKQTLPLSVSWTSSTEFRTNYSADASLFKGTGSYSVFLPSLDASLHLTDDIITRFSYSKTITRADLSQMRAATSVSGAPKLNQRTASSGNPGLLPYTSDNIDLSAEWYYNDTSYVSLGFFQKQVDNFIAVKEVNEDLFGLTDPYAGPRAALARQQLTAANQELTDANVLAQMVANQGQGDIITGDSTDPLIDWRVSKPFNAESAELWGWEFAIQHVFGESGFGASFNYTNVNGDIGYDNATQGYQFALPGMSDTYNIVGFYDKDGIQVRLAYNWRDNFLAATTTGTGNHPMYTEAYGQLDMTASYAITDNLTVSLEGLNVLDETMRQYSRYSNQLMGAFQYGARYNVGLRYTF